MGALVNISIRADVKRLTRDLGALADKQIPFATSQALNELAGIVKAAEVANLQKTFPSATPFTLKSLAILKAKKGNPTVTIFIKDKTARYLEPFETGGRHVLNSRALLNPKDIDLNQYGNLPRGKLAALRGRSDVFIGPVKGNNGQSINGVWQRIPARKGRSAGLKLLIRFGDALPVKQRLHYQSKASQVVAANIDRVFNGAMARAIATAST